MPSNVTELLAEIAREPAARRRRQLLLSNPDLLRPETVTRLYEEVIRLLHVDIPQAERMARATLAAGRPSGRRCLARCRPARHGPYLLPQA